MDGKIAPTEEIGQAEIAERLQWLLRLRWLIVPVFGSCLTSVPGPASVDSTVAQVLAVSAQRSVASTNYAVTLRHVTLFAE